METNDSINELNQNKTYSANEISDISGSSDSENSDSDLPDNIQNGNNLSEEHFNIMQEDILNKGKELEKIIQGYTKNRKKSSLLLPIQSLFDLFKRELKMNLILRQNLLEERANNNQLSNAIAHFQRERQKFFQDVSSIFSKEFSDYIDLQIFLKDQIQTIQQNKKYTKKKEKIFQSLSNLQNENEQLKSNIETLNAQLTDNETQNSIEVAQYISKISNLEEQITQLGNQNKGNGSKLTDLQSIIDKKKKKIKALKLDLQNSNNSNLMKLKEANEKLIESERKENNYLMQIQQIKKESEEKTSKIDENLNELYSLRIKNKKITLLEDENGELQLRNNDLQNQVQQLNDQLSEFDKYKEMIPIIQAKYNGLKKKKEIFHNLCKDLASQLNQKKIEFNKVKENLAHITSEIDSIKSQHENEIERIKLQYSQQMISTNQKLSALEDKFYLIQKNYSFCDEENKRLHHQLKQASFDINRLESENSKLLMKIEELSIYNESRTSNLDNSISGG